MQVFAHRPVGIELPQPGRLRPGAAKRVDHLIGAQRKERAGGCGGTERRHGAGRVPVAVVAGIDRLPDPERGLVANGHRRQELFA